MIEFFANDPDNPSEEVLIHSLEMADRSMEDIAAGRVLSIAEAKQRALDELQEYPPYH